MMQINMNHQWMTLYVFAVYLYYNLIYFNSRTFIYKNVKILNILTFTLVDDEIHACVVSFFLQKPFINNKSRIHREKENVQTKLVDLQMVKVSKINLNK